MLEVGETISDSSHRAGGHCDVGADTEHEEHKEEQHREDLWQSFEFGDGIGVRDERQAGTSFDHTTNIICANLMRQVSQNTEDRESGQQRGGCVQQSYNCGIAIDIVTELVEGRVHDDVAKADGQRVEALCDGGIPHLRVQNLAPLWLDEVQNAIGRSWQCYCPHQQDTHDDIREESQKVRGLAGALHAASYDEEDTYPGEEQTQDQFPVG